MNQPPINILLTFDYELPLGGIKNSYHESLFEPCDTLLELARKLNVPLNFFVDILCYERLTELGEYEFTDGFSKQLLTAHNEGHDVQLHIHPHWPETKIEHKRFISSRRFTLAAFSNEKYPNNIEGIIERSKTCLEALMSSSSKPYKCLAYRGGGYNLSPAADVIINALYNNGIKIDSTISRNYFFKSDVSVVNYFGTPKKANWFLSRDGDLRKEHHGRNSIFEIAIANKPKSFFEVPVAFQMKSMAHLAPPARGDGMHHPPVSLNLHEKLCRILSHRILSFDTYTFKKEYPLKILDHYLKKHLRNEPLYLAVVSHPKAMGKYSFELMDHFVKACRAKYGSSLVFKTFRQVCAELNL